MTTKYLTATAVAALLAFGAGYPAFSQSATGGEGSAQEPDCPEDMDTEAGCDLEGEVTERQPVPGAATAPVEPGVGDADKTMEGPDAGASGDAASGTSPDGSDGSSTDTAAAASEEDCPEDMDTEAGCAIEGEASERGPVEGAATAPVEPETDADATMAAPDTEDPDAGATDDPATMDGESEAASGGDEASAAPADANIVMAYEDGGRYYTEEDVPTYHINDAGEVDWLTYSGFRRYHSECHVCHGPDGEGSSYAPAVKDSAVNMDYYDFYDVVVNGRKHVGAADNSVMPSFGDNANVMCYLDDIYVYLKARGTEAIPRGRPGQKEAKSDAIQEAENACMGM